MNEGLSAASTPRRPEPPGQRTSRRRPGTLEESDGGFEPPQSNCRGPAALANEASGHRGRASPSGLACDHRRHPGTRLALAGRALRMPVAPASGGLSRTTPVTIGQATAQLTEQTRPSAAGRRAAPRIPDTEGVIAAALRLA